MRLISLSVLFLLLSVLLSGCNPNSKTQLTDVDPEQARGGNIKDGEQSIFYKDGKLKYKVEYKNGKANGRVRQYYTDGKLYMEATFKDGRRHGKCTYFTKKGSAFSVSNYENGSKEGIETKYWENGKVLSVNTFKQDKVQPGLVEYKQDGKKIENDVTIIITEVDHTSLEGKYYLHISLSNPKIVANFYSRPASEQVARKKIAKSGNKAILEFDIAPGGFLMKKLVIDAEYKTPRGNTMRLQRMYNLAAD